MSREFYCQKCKSELVESANTNFDDFTETRFACPKCKNFEIVEVVYH